MSVSDPLIKDIKECTLRVFYESSTRKISDSSQNLQNLCHALEKIFYKGLIQNQNIFYGNKKNDAYAWMSSLNNGQGDDLGDFNYKNSIREVENCKNVNTSLGKFRLLIRHCLVKKCLHYPLQCSTSSNKIKTFYEKNSIIGDEVLSFILLSVLLQCDKISFDLELSNSYFLDLTWQIPQSLRLELVPCRNLGISVSFSENRAVIVDIAPHSVASECGEISKGDVLANLNGVEINSSSKGRLTTILRFCKGKPISAVIIKTFHKQTEEIFLPMKHILRNLQIDFCKMSPAHLKTSPQNSYEEEENGFPLQNTKMGYMGTYLGLINVGNNGSVKQIEEAIKRCIRTSSRAAKKSIIFDIGEINIKIRDIKTDAVIFKHSYMQISACGSVPKLPNYIAYIAEDKNEDAASNFVSYVFYVENIEDADTILRNIGQGFYRTHFAV